jgi:ribosomal protein S18 acetylase RimI-like enzyme
LCKLSTNSQIWVIDLNNELVGTGTILYEYKFIHDISILAHIEDICIDENHRGQKFGKILIDYLIKEANEKNCYKITLYCSDELEKFYKFCNFVILRKKVFKWLFIYKDRLN